MEDSNGYLKKMYEQQICAYQQDVADLQAKLAESAAAITALQSKVNKLEE